MKFIEDCVNFYHRVPAHQVVRLAVVGTILVVTFYGDFSRIIN